MVPSKLSFSTVDDLTNDIPEYRPRGGTTNTYSLPVFEHPTCRICLDDCEDIPYCLCKGSSMIHQSCLR